MHANRIIYLTEFLEMDVGGHGGGGGAGRHEKEQGVSEVVGYILAATENLI
jgi:hypothetical protein